MTMGRLAVIALAAVLALGGIGTAFAQLGGDDDSPEAGTPIELRKDDAAFEIAQDDDVGDGDDTLGDDGTAGGDNTGDGDRTRGNDGTGGGDNTYVASATGGGGGGGGGGDSASGGGGGSAT